MTSSTPRILCLIGLVASTLVSQAQCVYVTFDDFNEEGIGDPTCGAFHTMVTPHWFNRLEDETDWVPWMGQTPTGHTGPGALPDFDVALSDSPIDFSGFSAGLRSIQRQSEEERRIDAGTYLYVESTDCCGNRAILESDTLDFSNHANLGMIFWYHMFGSTMGSLAMEVSADGGENWETVWERPDPATGWTLTNGAGPNWQLGGANLSAQLAGHSEALIRLVATVGLGGEYSDIAIDNLIVLAEESYPVIHNEGTLEYEEIPDECRLRVTFDKPSDLCGGIDHELESADLRLSLNMGDIHRYGGTDLDGGVTVRYTLGLPESEAPGFEAFTPTTIIPASGGDPTFYSGPHTLTIPDSEHPEHLAIHDFSEFYEEPGFDFIDVFVSSVEVGENPDYPVYLDDVQLDVEIDIHEKMDAYGHSVSLNSPVVSSSSLGGPVQFSWTPDFGIDCAFPTYRFQLLRLHDFGGGTCSDGPYSSMSEADWSRSALTLEVGATSVDLTMMEGSGFYAWRVMPIGDMHPGGAGNDLNWGQYSEFVDYSTAAGANPQDICDDSGPGVFDYTDPDEDKNRSYGRSFSRNLTEEGETLLVRESASFTGGSGFVQQTQALSRSQGVALVQGSVRSYKGMTPLQFLPVPLIKTNLNYEPDILQATTASGGLKDYGPDNFDSGNKFREPDPLSESATTGGQYTLGAYWSDSNEDDLRIPSAGGYPYSAIEYTRDGTNRPLAKGAAGSVLRLQPDGYTTKIKYASVTREELIRIFGNEAPNHKKVEKTITISPENVTTISYIDLTGRVLATCLGSNPNVDEDKIVVLAPEEGFNVTNELVARQYGNPYFYEAETSVAFEEEMTIELDYALEGNAFQSACYTFCRTCDYAMKAEVINLDNNVVVFNHELDVAQQECSGGASVIVPSQSWSDQVPLQAGRYSIRYEVRLNNSNGTSTYLEQARDELEEETDDAISVITDPLEALLEDIIDNDGSISSFFEYCDEEASQAVDSDSDGITDYYTFNLGASSNPLDPDFIPIAFCDQIRVDADTCKYDCNPETRDFEAFVIDVVSESIQAALEQGIDGIGPDEARDINPCDPGGPYCYELSTGRGWFDTYPYSTGANWNSPRNIAANNYGVDDGEFNTTIENMLAAHDANPIIYDTYSCINVYSNLESICQDLIYYASDTLIVDKLLDQLGYHFQGAASAPGNFSSQEGYKTHPFKYVDIDDYTLGSDECSDENSAFGAVDLSELSYSNEEDREVIESTYFQLHNCLHGLPERTAADNLADTDVGDLHEDNIYERWVEMCDDILDDKADYLEGKAYEAVFLSFFPGGYLYDEDAGYTADDLIGFAECYSAAIMKYASELCYYEQPNLTFNPEGVITSPIQHPEPSKNRVVDVPNTGGFVRTNRGEYHPFSKAGSIFITDITSTPSDPMLWDAINDGNGGMIDLEQGTTTVSFTEPFSADPFLSTLPTEEDMQLLTALAMGTTALTFDPTETSDGTVTIAEEGDQPLVRQEQYFFEGFDSFCSLPANVHTCAFSGIWKRMHDAGGAYIPQLLDYRGNTVLSLQCGANDPINPTHVEGNGVRTEGAIDLTGAAFGSPSSGHYELDVKLNFVEGTNIDNLYFIFRKKNAPNPFTGIPGDPNYTPENSITREVLYPIEAPGQFVAIHEKNVGDLWSEEWQSLTARFQLPPDEYNLYVYMKQELNSDPVEIMLDSLQIFNLSECEIPATLYADFEIWDPEPYEPAIESCDQVIARTILDKVVGEKERIIEEYDENLVESYQRNCAPEDALTAAYSLNYYQYTLNYYDPLGRLIRTVAPKGVDSTNTTRSVSPDHTFVTEYAYNGLGNMVRKHTPDGGEVNTWYDRLERVRFTQTAEDVAQDRFRYVCYDEQDRLVRSGVKEFTGGSAENLSNFVDDLDWPNDDPTDPSDCTGCSERKYIVYDTPLDPMPSGFSQENLTNRISYSTNEEGDITAYSYDARGHYNRLYQHVDLSEFSIPDFDHFIEYDFDEATGIIRTKRVNPGREDQFYHQYAYNEDQKLACASSSSDGKIWHNDIEIEYSATGKVKRTQLGHFSAQGVDHTYNIQGQTIGINLPTEDIGDDPGQDGLPTGPHPWVAPDAFAQQFNYYSGDFNRSDSPFNAGNSRIDAHDYFDGNLSGLSWMQRSLFDSSDDEPIVGRTYQVDELSRLHDASFSQLQSSTWTASAAHHSTYDYDENGNLTHLTRTDENGVSFDDLSYTYEPGSNRLNHVADESGAPTGEDVASQVEDNYTYDEDGRLQSDAAEGILSFAWRSSDKVDQVTLADGSTVKYRYDATGNRIAKIADDATTLYLRDASGATIAMYTYSGGSSFDLSEHLLSNGRFLPKESITSTTLTAEPDFRRRLGQREYALSDQVDNVRTVVSDQTTAVDGEDGTVAGVSPIILSSFDYAPYGSLLATRSHEPSNYRYAFNGKEQENEVKGGNGNHYDLGARHYDPRLGRMLSIDPRTMEFAWQSPYAYHGNQPHNSIDFNGEGPYPTTYNGNPSRGDRTAPSASQMLSGGGFQGAGMMAPEMAFGVRGHLGALIGIALQGQLMIPTDPHAKVETSNTVQSALKAGANAGIQAYMSGQAGYELKRTVSREFLEEAGVLDAVVEKKNEGKVQEYDYSGLPVSAISPTNLVDLGAKKGAEKALEGILKKTAPKAAEALTSKKRVSMGPGVTFGFTWTTHFEPIDGPAETAQEWTQTVEVNFVAEGNVGPSAEGSLGESTIANTHVTERGSVVFGRIPIIDEIMAIKNAEELKDPNFSKPNLYDR